MSKLTTIAVHGDAQPLHAPGASLAVAGQLVALAELGGNNGENSFGWCGLKCVVLAGGNLWVVDYPAQAWMGGAELPEWAPNEMSAASLPLGLLDLRASRYKNRGCA